MKKLLTILVAMLLVAGTLSANAANEKLLSAVKSGDYKAIRAAFRAGADVDAVDETGRSAMVFAIREGDIKAVRLILKKRPNLENIYHLPRTAKLKPSLLTVAVLMRAELDLLKLLIKSGAPVNRLEGETPTCPLFAAFQVDSLETAKLLIKHGADINQHIQSDYNNFNALYYIIMSKNEADDLESLKLLLDSGFKIEKDHKYIETAKLLNKNRLAEELSKIFNKL